MQTFIDKIVPFDGNTALLEDIYLKGGFRIVADEYTMYNLDHSLLAKGMIVKCQSSGLYYRANIVRFNADGSLDTIEWKHYTFDQYITPGSNTPVLYNSCTATFTVDITKIKDGKSVKFGKELGCRSFFLLNLRMSAPVKLELFSRKDLQDINPYTFIAKSSKLSDSGESYVRSSSTNVTTFLLKTSTYSIIVNEDIDTTSTTFYFRLTKNLKMLDSSTVNPNKIIVEFEYIPIEM